MRKLRYFLLKIGKFLVNRYEEKTQRYFSEDSMKKSYKKMKRFQGGLSEELKENLKKMETPPFDYHRIKF